MTVNQRQIEFLARALANRLEDRGVVEFHDAEIGIELVVRTLAENLRDADDDGEETAR
ncbi:MAG: hypothetical protein ACXW2F_09855 [Thermoanaerobaculia bacterium]